MSVSYEKQNHGFLAALNGRGGIVTEGVLRALSIPFEYARDPHEVGRQIREAYTFSQSSLSPVALLLTRDLMEDAL